MPMLTVLQFPDPRLRKKALPVEAVDESIKRIVNDMFDTLYGSENCAGYAATQMNIQKRIVVIDLSAKRNEPLCLINPVIVEARGETFEPEGCMSVPDVYEPVKRAEWIKFKALDRAGKPFEVETDGFLARCVQHEIDHLNGILFIDYLSKLKRERYMKKIQKAQAK